MKIQGIEVPGVLKIDNARVYGLEESIIASAYPKMTNTVDMDKYLCCDGTYEDGFITEKDIKRAKILGTCKSGTGHDCYEKGIIIQFDLKMSEYMWRQWDRYHFNDYVSSQSKMHKILELDIDSICNKYVITESIDNLNYLIEMYNNFDNEAGVYDSLLLRNGEEIEYTKENIFEMIISNCPAGLMLGARVTFNYLQAKSIKLQRKHHKMQTWNYICDFFDTLPMFKEITEKEIIE